MLDFGDRLGRFCNKCAQVSALRARPPSMKEAVRNILSQACRNCCRSGFAGSAKEAKSLQSVVTMLRCVDMRVRVVDVQCKVDFWGGNWLGMRSMGGVGGTHY